MRGYSLRNLLYRALRPGRLPRTPAARRSTCPPAVELLEDGTVPSTLAPLTTFNPALPPSDSAGGTASGLTSADGRFTVYSSTAANAVTGQVDTAVATNIFLYDRQTKTTTLVSHVAGSATTGADADSVTPRISSDGRYVEYSSAASNLVTGQAGPRGEFNVFLYDSTTGNNTLVSHRFDSATTAGNGICDTLYTTGFGFGDATGNYLLFNSYATDLVGGQTGPVVENLFLYNTATGTNTLVSHDSANPLQGANDDSLDADITPDGSAVVYKSFATDVVSGQTGPKGNIFLYFPSDGSNLLVSGAYDSSSFGNSFTDGGGFSQLPVISADGRYVAFISGAGNLVPNQATSGTATQNVFVFDSFTDETTLVSGAFGSDSVTANGDSTEVTLSSDGSTLAFLSGATNLVSGQGGNTGNVFLLDTSALSSPTHPLTLVSHANGSPTTAAGGVYTGVTKTFDDLTLSSTGRYVAYLSTANNLSAGEQNPPGFRNVFLYDASTGQNTLVSHVQGQPTLTGNGNLFYAHLNTDGTVIAFLGVASNLEPGVNIADGGQNVFEYDVASGAGPDLASRSAFRATATSLVYGTSADGRYVVFTSNATDVVSGQADTNADQDVFLLDRNTGTFTLVSHIPASPTTAGDHGSPSTVGGGGGRSREGPAVSADGNWVVFVSDATNLVPGESGETVNQANQVFVYNRLTGVVKLVSHDVAATTTNVPVGNDVSDSPVISADGRYIAYASNASNLVAGLTEPDPGVHVPNIYLYDTSTGVNTLVSHAAFSPTASGDLRSLTPAISDDDGSREPLVAYVSDATDLVSGATIAPTENVYLYDGSTGTTTLVSHQPSAPLTSATGSSSHPVLSADAGTLAFVSFANDLVPGQQPDPFTNVFLYNTATGIVTLASGVGGSASRGGGGYSDSPVLNDDGSRVAFRSDAPNLVAGQVNTAGTVSNVFLYDAGAGTVTLLSHAAGQPTTTAAGNSAAPAIDGLGGLVVYLSTATNLVPGQQGGGVNNVFLYAVALGVNGLVSGQGGSTTVAGTSPAYQAGISRDPIVPFNVLSGAGGTSVGFANSLVALELGPNTVALGSPPGSVVGTLRVDTVFGGQDRPATYTLPAGEANNAAFALAAAPGGAAYLVLATPAGGAGYVIRAHADIGIPDLGVLAALLNVYTTAAPPAVPAGRPDPLMAVLVPVRVGRSKTRRLMVQVLDLVTGMMVESVVCPFQAPAYRAITLAPLDLTGDGVADLIEVTARKGKHPVMVFLPA